MQATTAAPRNGLTDAQVLSVVTGDQVTIAAGCELLNTSNEFVDDISGDLDDGGQIDYDNRAAVRGSCRIGLLRPLAWGRDRVRLYMTLSDAAVTARFYLGVYVLTAPDEHRGETPMTYEVTGYDLLSLMQANVGDTWVVSAGTTYFAAAQAVVAASGIGAKLLLDSAAQDTVLPATRVWALTESDTTWLRILTDLLADIGYERPAMDPDGNIQSRPFRDASVRAPEFPLDVAAKNSIVEQDRTVSIEAGEGYNAWLFILANAEVTPVLGDGIYRPAANTSTGPNSITATGRTKTRVMYVQAADHAELVAQGDKVRAQDMAAVRTISLTINPLPLMWSDDVFTFTDLGVTEKLAAASWSLMLDGSSGPLQLGGAPALPAEPVNIQTKATVTNAAPLSVVIDGADTPSFANALDGAEYDIGNRVTVTIRNPVPPLVMGVES